MRSTLLCAMPLHGRICPRTPSTWRVTFAMWMPAGACSRGSNSCLMCNGSLNESSASGASLHGESLVADGEAVIETGVQDGAIALRIFAFFEVRWQITRRGRYTWRRTNGGRWHLSEVVLFSETIRRDGLGLADRARFAGPSQDPA